jgi:hypothetical protein
MTGSFLSTALERVVEGSGRDVIEGDVSTATATAATTSLHTIFIQFLINKEL